MTARQWVTEVVLSGHVEPRHSGRSECRSPLRGIHCAPSIRSRSRPADARAGRRRRVHRERRHRAGGESHRRDPQRHRRHRRRGRLRGRRGREPHEPDRAAQLSDRPLTRASR
ncbi:hypothetical protein EBN88_00570 [Streptomyces triticirhizae]|uniref:Uncharacterized protein n=1 Tax=Streptomyces triticirhizae TaxID=2483353 RepID=A0A3M2MAW5_9ACTN|nr:hypothetical protein EBN88_00570 [Streptomyces triticirhizae]